MRHYYAVMGPMYALKYDAAAAEQGRARGIVSPEAMAQAFAPGGFLQTFDLRPELSRITAPTLILAGQQDWICPPEFSEEIHRLIPGSQLQVLANSSHSLRVDVPEAMRAAISAFVTDAAPRG
jgi:proline iminopeptidase